MHIAFSSFKIGEENCITKLQIYKQIIRFKNKINDLLAANKIIGFCKFREFDTFLFSSLCAARNFRCTERNEEGPTDNLCLSRGALFLRCGNSTTTSWSLSRGSAYLGYALAAVAPFVDDDDVVGAVEPPAVEYFEYAMLFTLLLPP